MTIFAGLLAHSLILMSVGGIVDPQGKSNQSKPSFLFLKQEFVHRYTKGDLHEFTPKSQTNLKQFTDMVTVNLYPKVKTGQELAGVANSVLETYKASQAVVVRTDSVPRTATKPAQHLVVVLFPRPDFIEAAFARFLIDGGKGKSVVYSHRIYGKKAGDAMSDWLKANGPACEKALMSMSPIPKG